MCRCWEENPVTRPKFLELKLEIYRILEELESDKCQNVDEEYGMPKSEYERVNSILIFYDFQPISMVVESMSEDRVLEDLN